MPTSEYHDLDMDDSKFTCNHLLVLWPKSHSASFIKGCVDHMYNNRIIYSSNNYTSDPFFYAKVLCTINYALQVHWKCCASAVNHQSVYDHIL